MLHLAEPPTGRARLRSSLKSPRNPIPPFETSRVATLHPGLYTRFREGARRVIGATAKPLYPIDGKAEGLDRRSPQDLPLRGRGTARGGGRSPWAVEGVRGRWKESADGGRSPRRWKESADGGRSPQTMIPPRSQTPHSSCEFGFFLHMHHMPRMPKAYDVFFKNHQVSFRRMSRASAGVYGESISHSSALMRRMPS